MKRHSLALALLCVAATGTANASWAMTLASAGPLDGSAATASATSSATASEPVPRVSVTGSGNTTSRGGYVARNDNLRVFFDALSPSLGKPIIVSKVAAKKQVSGDFDLTNARALLESLAAKLGLIWYHDGQSIYVYDASEVRSATVSLRYARVADVTAYLRTTGLYDRRYQVRGDTRNGVFYVSGPPVYVDLVLAAAKSLDRVSRSDDAQASAPEQIGVVRMDNAFVSDRTYALRDEKIVIPGMETIVRELVASGDAPQPRPAPAVSAPRARLGAEDADDEASAAPANADTDAAPDAPEASESPTAPVVVRAYPAGNSLIVKGTAQQVERIERLVTRLDVPRRHIELSLWIIDLRKEALDSLGIDWSGGANLGSKVGLLLNATTPVSTLDGVRFLAQIHALASNGRATVVSRPVILAQENIPALFDGSQTFYVPLEGERSTDLRSVTYGTMVSVWPRFAGDDEIEMTLNIEDGTSAPPRDSDSKYTALPTVSRTHISTIARVPQGKSLLIGGYTRDSGDTVEKKIPLLGDIPLLGRLFHYTSSTQNNNVRVFLIQPREIGQALARDASDIGADTVKTLPYPQDAAVQAVRAATELDARPAPQRDNDPRSAPSGTDTPPALDADDSTAPAVPSKESVYGRA
ncbi:Outer membrane protein MxiD [Pandoraea pneumonica]|uniref:Type 3 secretion system secretin n=1 Tax=Pandoraea pneumonica TaxID=2508299 RepID=A0A5E4UVZ2_9BURK|nr:type III secretion system outer membrane ring subunit SctC [Pandoraea pneumonica]VVE04128.1 Outer membrane protein MxiD [Pandoraea pneumonica]